MKQRFVILFLGLILSVSAYAQNYYWIGFTDKSETEYSLSRPEEYLSQRAIERRVQQNIAIDSLDLPVNRAYIDSVLTLDVALVHASKWLNGITIATSLDSLEFLTDWSFVREIQRTKPGTALKSTSRKFQFESAFGEVTIDTSYYGGSVYQVGMLNGQFLHNNNFRGKGLQIAVLDGGFYKADALSAFDSLWANGQILGTRDFVDPESDIFTTDAHGMNVLSCMGGNIPGQLIGTAPDAEYWLLRTEDVDTEYIIEEDNWARAAEFADSVGVDIINSSLGYSEFDDPSTDHSYADMDGNTTRITQAANIAASRGILVVTSAGNERYKSWFRIVAPSDGEGVLGVAAVDKNEAVAYFSSAGPASSGAVKPNVAAMGVQTVVQGSEGYIGYASGTSFSSPVMAGMAASLWQMFPEKTAQEIKAAIESSGSQYNAPDSLLGYGIPDMQLAAELLGFQAIENLSLSNSWQVYPNPVRDHFFLRTEETFSGTVLIECLAVDGSRIKTWTRDYAPLIEIRSLAALTRGIYFLRISNGSRSEVLKLSKL